MFRTATAAIVVLTATAGLAQGISPVAAPVRTPLMSQKQSVAARKNMSSVAGNQAAGVQAPATLRERVQDMEATLAKMHTMLKQMRAKTASSSKDSFAKADLEMWQLMVGHLDKQFQDLRLAMLTREDMEARRAAMYKQAEAQADAAAQAARIRASKPPAPAPAAQGAGQSAAGQAPANAGVPPTLPANASPSPN